MLKKGDFVRVAYRDCSHCDNYCHRNNDPEVSADCHENDHVKYAFVECYEISVKQKEGIVNLRFLGFDENNDDIFWDRTYNISEIVHIRSNSLMNK